MQRGGGDDDDKQPGRGLADRKPEVARPTENGKSIIDPRSGGVTPTARSAGLRVAPAFTVRVITSRKAFREYSGMSSA